MTRHQTRLKAAHGRSGLAPLELTLSLPLLLMLMALMINFGVVGAWKVRTQGNAHYAAFRSLQVRTGDANPPPDNWPNANLNSGSGNSLPTVGQLWEAHPDTTHPRADWVRGDWLTAPNQVVPVHVEGRLEFDEGVHSGTASMSRNVPFLRGATASGRFGFSLTQEVLDNRWQFHTQGMSDNLASRTRVWWDIEHNDLVALDAQIANFKAQLDAAQQLLISNPQIQYLYPLDQDIEFSIYSATTPPTAPNFYPGTGGCSLDVNEVQLNSVDPLNTRIRRLPCTMSQAFLDLYRTWICRMEHCGATAQATAPLRDRYNDLRQFVNSLPMELRCGSVPALTPCEECDPMDAACWSQCPAPEPDLDGL